MSTSRKSRASRPGPTVLSSDSVSDSSEDSGLSPGLGGSLAGSDGGGADSRTATDGPEYPRLAHPEIHVETQQPPTPTSTSSVPVVSQPYPGVIPGFDHRPTTPSTAPSLFQPLSPIQSQYPSSPSAPPSISSLPSNSAVPSVSPSLAPYHYFGILNPHRIGIAPPSPVLRQFGSSSSRPVSPLSTSSARHPLHDAEQTPSARHPSNGHHLGHRGRDDDIDDIDDDDSVLQDSKDVLAQRLSDLAQRITLSPRRDIDTLHGKVDEMERSMTNQGRHVFLATPTRHYPPHLAASMPLHHSYSHPHQRPSTSDNGNNGPASDPHGERFWQGANPGSRSPPWLRPRTSEVSPLARHSQPRLDASFITMGMRFGVRQPSVTGSTAGASATGDFADDDHTSNSTDQRRMVPMEDMKRVIDEAERLNSELLTLMTNLRARQEESDHIHSLLVERAERAAQRIIFLQGRVTHLEDELHTNDSELQNLRIQLKAIEVQCPPSDTLDPDLRQSIENWKDDWAVLRQKRAARVAAAAASSLLNPEDHPGTDDQTESSTEAGDDVAADDDAVAKGDVVVDSADSSFLSEEGHV